MWMLIILAPFLLYVVVRIVTLAYFNSKRDYFRRLFHGDSGKKAEGD